MTALMLAAQKGQLEVVVKLAELGVDLATANNVSLVIFYLEGLVDTSNNAFFMLVLSSGRNDCSDMGSSKRSSRSGSKVGRAGCGPCRY